MFLKSAVFVNEPKIYQSCKDKFLLRGKEVAVPGRAREGQENAQDLQVQLQSFPRPLSSTAQVLCILGTVKNVVKFFIKG